MKQLVPALFAVGAIMALTGAAVYITGWNYAPYIYTIGAGFIALAQVNTPVKGKSKILKRLRIQQILHCFPHSTGRSKRREIKKPVQSFSVLNRHQFIKIMNALRKPKGLKKHFYFLADEYLAFNPSTISFVILYALSA